MPLMKEKRRTRPRKMKEDELTPLKKGWTDFFATVSLDDLRIST
jgi:hypothetical protein